MQNILLHQDSVKAMDSDLWSDYTHVWAIFIQYNFFWVIGCWIPTAHKSIFENAIMITVPEEIQSELFTWNFDNLIPIYTTIVYYMATDTDWLSWSLIG